eukprot:3691087-Karenia_brevis.AAC.1
MAAMKSIGCMAGCGRRPLCWPAHEAGDPSNASLPFLQSHRGGLAMHGRLRQTPTVFASPCEL